MIMPSANGPRSLTLHVAVAPDCALIVTIVPIGNVRWAHVPGGAASYHVAPPLWLRPDGAGAADPDEPDPVLGAALAGAGAGFGAAFTVVVVRRTTVVGGVVLAVVGRTRLAAAVDDVVSATVVGGAVGTGVSERLTRLSAGRASGPAATETAPVNAWGGDEDGGGDECSNASAGAPAIAAQSATGTARRAFLDPRVVRTPPLLQNAGAALHRLLIEAHPATFQICGS
jgi:hypothetical protein